MAASLSPLDPQFNRGLYRTFDSDSASLCSIEFSDFHFDVINEYNSLAKAYLKEKRGVRPKGYDWDHLEDVADFSAIYGSRISQDPDDILPLIIAGKGHDLVKGDGNDAILSSYLVSRLMDDVKGKFSGKEMHKVEHAVQTAVRLIEGHEDYKSARLFQEITEKFGFETHLLSNEIVNRYTRIMKRLKDALSSSLVGAEVDRPEKLMESLYKADVRARARLDRIIVIAYGYLNNPMLYTGSGKSNFLNIRDFLREKWHYVRPEEMEALDKIIDEGQLQYEREEKGGNLIRLVSDAQEQMDKELQKRLAVEREEEKDIYSEAA